MPMIDWKKKTIEYIKFLGIEINDKESCDIYLRIKFNEGKVFFINQSKEITRK